MHTVTGEKSLCCIPETPVSPEERIGEWLKECFKIFGESANTRIECGIGFSIEGLAYTNYLNVILIVQNAY